MRRPIAIFAFLCILSLVLLACSGPDQSPSQADAGTQASSSPTSSKATPDPTRMSVSTSASVKPIPIQNSLSSTIIFFYQALEAKNYSRAYIYISANATISGQKLTQATFTHMAQAADSTSGPINNFTFIANSADHTQIIVTITRTTGSHYHSHLQFQQENSNWKLMQIDII